MKIPKEVKIGFIVILTLGLMYYGFYFLKGENIFKKERIYYSVYDNVKGLRIANNVDINGYKIGQVKDIYFLPGDTSGRLVVKFLIEKDIAIPDNSIAVIENDLLGVSTINIRLGNSETFININDTLESMVSTSIQDEINLQMLPVKNKLEGLMVSLDTALMAIRYIFNETTRENLAKSFESIKLTIQNLESTTYNIDTLVSSQRMRFARIFGNIESISHNIAESNDKINNVITNFSNVSDSLAQIDFSKTMRNADKTLNEVAQIVEKINKGEGSLGLLVNNDSLYNNLESATKELDELLLDMKLHPKRYVHFSVFGKSDKKNKYTPAEEEK
ncbi:MAG: MlaD family protein [Saprospiraceae bacterium]|nr:MlaD family protein [Saprospiraceae bacterium]